MSQTAVRCRIVVVAAAVAAGWGGCGRSTATVSDPLSDVRNTRWSQARRVRAIDEAWAQMESGGADRLTVREELKTVAWSANWPLGLRMAALRKLASDTTEKGRADTRAMFRLMLPRETDPTVTAFLSEQAAAGGWTEATAALVRSLSRVWPGTKDADRPEYKAILALNGGRSVQEVVYGVFLDPPQEGGAFGLLPTERVRADAWDLLARVDSDGTARARLLAMETGPGPVADMQASLKDLRCLPLTGDELRWLTSLHDLRDPAKRTWWERTSAAVGALNTQDAGKLQLRHLESIRWASEHRPELLTWPRDSLLETLRERLADRSMHRRRKSDLENWRPASEKLADWQGRLTWPDLVSLLVIDEAVRETPVAAALLAQAEMDRDDTTAEYGGLLRSPTGPTGASVVLYPPRPGSRQGDRQFVASTDMVSQGDTALAHYHFHVQEVRNSEYAGPSSGDLAYAARSGRSCLVFTSVSAGVLNVDVYQPDGVVLDLGDIRGP